VSSNKIAYAASSNLTVTNLHSLGSSTTLVAGWSSALVDNTTNLYLDYLVSGKITAGTGLSDLKEIRVYAVAMLDDSTWPDAIDGTQGAKTLTDEEIRDGFCKLLTVISTDTGAGDVYYFGPCSVAQAFGGVCPAKFCIFIVHNTGAALSSSGNQVTVKGVYTTNA